MYSFYDDLLGMNDDLCIFDAEKKSLRMKDHLTPVSITEDEFNWLAAHVCISSHMNFLSYDMATAFGISSLALAQHPFTTVVSMDSYIEEQFNNPSDYQGQSQTYQDSDGFKVANRLKDKWGLRNIDYYCGHSPTDVETILNKYGGKLIRHAFIDAAHFDENLVADIRAIAPFMDKGGTWVAIHDIHCFSPEAIKECEDILHKKFDKIELQRTYGMGRFL